MTGDFLDLWEVVLISGKTNPKEDEGGPDLALVRVPIGLRSDVTERSLNGRGGPAWRTGPMESSRLRKTSVRAARITTGEVARRLA
jgi:hypothetical protein